MLQPEQLIEKAKTSSFYLWLLNRVLFWVIPFNKPHGFAIKEITDETITTRLPFRRSNFNHIKSIHACAMATIAEFTSGLMMLQHLNAKKYRIILKSLHMDYHFQGKREAYAKFSASKSWIQEQVLHPLKTEEAVVVLCEVKIMDLENNHLATGKVEWQIKSWDKVKTKV